MCNILYIAPELEKLSHSFSEQWLLCSSVCGQLTIGVAGSAHFLEDWWTSAQMGLPPGSLPTTRFQGLLVTDGKVSGSFYISLPFCIPVVTIKKLNVIFVRGPADGGLGSIFVCFWLSHFGIFHQALLKSRLYIKAVLYSYCLYVGRCIYCISQIFQNELTCCKMWKTSTLNVWNWTCLTNRCNI